MDARLMAFKVPALAWVIDSACALTDLFDPDAATEFSHELGLNKFVLGALKEILPEFYLKFCRQRVVAAQKPLFQHCGADGKIF